MLLAKVLTKCETGQSIMITIKVMYSTNSSCIGYLLPLIINIILLSLVAMFFCAFTADFFPFGAGEGDKVGPRGVDEVTMAVSLPVPIVLNLKEHTALYVSK